MINGDRQTLSCAEPSTQPGVDRYVVEAVSKGVVGSCRQHLGGGTLGECVRGLCDCRSHAYACRSPRVQVRNGWSSWACHHIERRRESVSERLDRVFVGGSRHENAARAGVEVCTRTGDRRT